MPRENISSPHSPCRPRKGARSSTATANRANPARSGPRRRSGLSAKEGIAIPRSAPVEAQDVEEETRQDRLKAERTQGHAGNDPAQGPRVIEVAEVDQPPLVHGEQQQPQSRHEGYRADENSPFQGDNLEKPRQARVFREDPLADGKRLGEHGEEERLIAQEDGQGGNQERVYVEMDAADADSRQGE